MPHFGERLNEREQVARANAFPFILHSVTMR